MDTERLVKTAFIAKPAIDCAAHWREAKNKFIYREIFRKDFMCGCTPFHPGAAHSSGNGGAMALQADNVVSRAQGVARDNQEGDTRTRSTCREQRTDLVGDVVASGNFSAFSGGLA